MISTVCATELGIRLEYSSQGLLPNGADDTVYSYYDYDSDETEDCGADGIEFHHNIEQPIDFGFGEDIEHFRVKIFLPTV